MSDRANPSASADTACEESEALRAVIEATATATGEEWLRAMVEHVARVVGAQHAVVAELEPERSWIKTRAFFSAGAHVAEQSWPIAGSPWVAIVAGEACQHASGVSETFPAGEPFGRMSIASFAGTPLIDPLGAVRGVVAIFDERPMAREARWTNLLRLLAARAIGEIGRVDVERRLRESEELFRSLFDEAPIAYVYEGTDTHFVSANRTAMNLLGLTPEDVPHTYGISLVAPGDLDEVQGSLNAEQSGQERAAIEIELRRKDDGGSVWVQRWSRPEPDGKHTRTMIIDITARVLAERERARLLQQNSYLQEEIKSEHNFEEIVGRSAAIRKVLAQIEQVARTEATVLLLGDTGTGKELIARALHDASQRKGRPLIKVNCAALPAGLVESELFGHERGAFTGATEKRVGRFALADGGTIFLDEIGELAPEVQTKLLRVLQERSFEALGSTRTQRVDVRVVAATNRDLQRAVAEGAFRADLFYRLNVFPVHVPSLAERREDIPLLVHYFVARYATKNGRQIATVHPDTMQRLTAYAWPGNIRELENVIERAVILARGPTLEIGADVIGLPEPGGEVPRGGEASIAGREGVPRATRSLADAQRGHILEALRATNWVIDGEDGAACRLGLKPSTLRNRLKKLGIQRERGIEEPR